jgi:hypothetical protein
MFARFGWIRMFAGFGWIRMFAGFGSGNFDKSGTDPIQNAKNLLGKYFFFLTLENNNLPPTLKKNCFCICLL